MNIYNMDYTVQRQLDEAHENEDKGNGRPQYQYTDWLITAAD
jgi:hypothetical protein